MTLGLDLFPKGMAVSAKIWSEPAHDPHSSMIPQLATFHLASCLETINYAIQYENNFHSVAICLLRQCVEALTILDLGLQPPEQSQDSLKKWEEGRLSLGEVRQLLEGSVWTRYGSGLWSESWAVFFRNLAKAVQPYSHYTNDLLGWQIKPIGRSSGSQFLANLSPRSRNPIRTARIAVVQAVITWAFVRLLIANRKTDATSLVVGADQLKEALASSRLLWPKEDWATVLMPHMLYGPEAEWMDP